MDTLPAPPSDQRGGLVFEVEGRTFFLSAEHARKLAPRPQIARLPGAAPSLLGLVLEDGGILPVVELGPERATMIVCVHRGEQLGLLGAVGIRSGVFPADPSGGVTVDGKVIPALDLAGLYARLHAATWGASWGG